jgi:hypothetical protein
MRVRPVRSKLFTACFVIALASCAATERIAPLPTTRALLEVDDAWILSPAPELKQRGVLDGGPTALAIVAARWGLDPVRADLVASVASGDVSIAWLRAAARALGLYAFTVSADWIVLVHEVRRGRPVLIALDRSPEPGRYEVVVGVNVEAGLVATIDPGAGWRVRTLAELEREWAPGQHPALLVRGVMPGQAVSDDPSTVASRASRRR